MKTNDLKKDTRILLQNGWYAKLLDNKKGNIRFAEVHGIVTEMGFIYSHDIVAYDVPGKPGWQTDIEYTKSQLDCHRMNQDLLGG